MTSPQDPGQPWMQDPNQAPPVDPTAPYSAPPSYPSQPDYQTPPGYPTQPGYAAQPGYTPAPGYAPQPGYAAPSGYAPPAGYGYPVYVQPAPSMNTLAIVALVLAFVFAPAAIVCGHIARKQIRSSGESGDGLALAGLICGYVFTGLQIIFCGIYIALFASVIGSSDNTDALHLLNFVHYI
jgi:hypothetical protein